ncbi:uncharacterized protein [Struthio camelus]|uniref:uncharacterized protein isoform X3 n=1 Tax=Struthio camelus TaxID=8801 RepID=UPI003603C344
MGEVTRQILNTLVQTKEETTIHLSSAVFPQTSPWFSAFWILFTLFLLSIAASAFMVCKAKQKMSKKKAAEEEYLNIQGSEKNILHSDILRLQEQCGALRRELKFRRA